MGSFSLNFLCAHAEGIDVAPPSCCRTRSFAGLNHLHKAEAGGHGRDKRLIGCAGKPCFIEVNP